VSGPASRRSPNGGSALSGCCPVRRIRPLPLPSFTTNALAFSFSVMGASWSTPPNTPLALWLSLFWSSSSFSSSFPSVLSPSPSICHSVQGCCLCHSTIHASGSLSKSSGASHTAMEALDCLSSSFPVQGARERRCYGHTTGEERAINLEQETRTAGACERTAAPRSFATYTLYKRTVFCHSRGMTPIAHTVRPDTLSDGRCCCSLVLAANAGPMVGGPPLWVVELIHPDEISLVAVHALPKTPLGFHSRDKGNGLIAQVSCSSYLQSSS